jgi:hypothetical protein
MQPKAQFCIQMFGISSSVHHFMNFYELFMNSITLAAFERAALCPPVPSGKLHLTEPEDLYPGTEQQASSDEKGALSLFPALKNFKALNDFEKM